MARKGTKNLTSERTYVRPKPPLGPYTKPRVTAIKLDPEQAILTSCRGGAFLGMFMSAGGNSCLYTATFTGTRRCVAVVRNEGWAVDMLHHEALSEPS